MNQTTAEHKALTLSGELTNQIAEKAKAAVKIATDNGMDNAKTEAFAMSTVISAVAAFADSLGGPTAVKHIAEALMFVADVVHDDDKNIRTTH